MNTEARGWSIVTGATRGLGLGVARDLTKRGHRVLFTGRDESVVRAKAAEAARAGGSAGAHALDVTSDESVRDLARFVGNAPVDVLVNNAGISMRGFDANVARKTIDTNFYGAMRVTDALAPRLSPGARVVMVSSGMGEVSCLSRDLQRAFLDPALDRKGLLELVESFVRDVAEGVHSRKGWPSSAYSVSKVAMNALTRIVAREIPSVRVNAVCPGWVRTDMGGRSAPRSLEEGTASIVWGALLPPDGPTGGFFQDGHSMAW